MSHGLIVQALERGLRFPGLAERSVAIDADRVALPNLTLDRLGNIVTVHGLTAAFCGRGAATRQLLWDS